MHRVYNRCTENEDINHHTQFLKNVLDHRAQNKNVICGKFSSFHAKRKNPERFLRRKSNRIATSVTFDAVSKIHLFTRSCMTRSYSHIGLDSPPEVYSSFPKSGSKVSTKRSILGKVKSTMNHWINWNTCLNSSLSFYLLSWKLGSIPPWLY